MLCVLFFLQAEDGIRDLVRSRGLGDVYKRQIQEGLGGGELLAHEQRRWHRRQQSGRHHGSQRSCRYQLVQTLAKATAADPVSYTHLTLPTSDLV